jgi:hypothetical protein
MQHVIGIRFRRFLICCLVLDHPVAFTFGRLSPNLHFRTVFTKKNQQITVWKTFHDLDLDSHTCAVFFLMSVSEQILLDLVSVQFPLFQHHWNNGSNFVENLVAPTKCVPVSAPPLAPSNIVVEFFLSKSP